MHILKTRSVSTAFPEAMQLMREQGVARPSRNGDVLTLPGELATHYTHPWEKVVCVRRRRASPLLLLIDGLSILSEVNPLPLLMLIQPRFSSFATNGKMPGHYGYRLRRYFGYDQIENAVTRLKHNPDDRRIVLQLFDAHADSTDLDPASPDVCCNLGAVPRLSNGRLSLSVWNRSNDLIWGKYGANAAQFGFLLEYLAARLGVGCGTLTHHTANPHIYTANPAWIRFLQFTEIEANYAPGPPDILDPVNIQSDIDRLFSADPHEIPRKDWASSLFNRLVIPALFQQEIHDFHAGWKYAFEHAHEN